MSEEEFVPYTGEIPVPRSYYTVVIGKIKDEWAFTLYRSGKKVSVESLGPELDLHLVVNMIVASMAAPVSPVEVMQAIARPIRNLVLGEGKPVSKEAATPQKTAVALRKEEEMPAHLKNKWILAARSAYINFAFVLAFLNDNYGAGGLEKFYDYIKRAYVDSWKSLPNKQFRVVMKVMLETHDALRMSHNIINDAENDFESEVTIMAEEEVHAIREMFPSLPQDFPAVIVKIQTQALAEALGCEAEIDVKNPNTVHIHIKSAV